jgi:hypothetical protein
MKVIKSRLIGSRLIRAKELNIQLFQIRGVFNLHRDALVDRILTDLATYIDFKFHAAPSRQDLAQIFERLLAFKKRDVNMEFYEPLVRQFQRKDELQLTNDCFFLEIDELIRLNLNPQLNFAA